MADQTGTKTYTYDAQNRQTGKTSPQAGNFTYGYDANSNLASLVGAAGTTGYAYNNLNELTTLTDFDSTQTTFGYDANHHRTATNYPNGVVMTTSYDNSQRIASIVSAKAGTNLTNLAYSYTNPANGHDAMLQYSETDNVNSRTSAMTYDVVNRLTEFKISGSYTKDYQYIYDGNRNRVQQYEDGISTSYAYNNANEITTAGTLTYTFDPDGNELTNSGGLSYTYNPQNQTSNVSSTQPVNSLNMTYTGPGQSERLTAGNRSFTYSVMGMYSQTASGSFTSSVNTLAAPGTAAAAAPQFTSPVQAALTHNQPGTASVAQTSPSGAYYYTHDAAGALVSESTPSGKFYYSQSAIQVGIGPNPGALSTAAVTDSTGAVAASYLNCPSGNNIVKTGTAPNSWHLDSSYYDSSYYDSTTGTQLYFGNGVYDSTIARWNQSGYELTMGSFIGGPAQPFAGYTIPLRPPAGSVSVGVTGAFGPVGITGGFSIDSAGRIYPYLGYSTGAQVSAQALWSPSQVTPYSVSIGAQGIAPFAQVAGEAGTTCAAEGCSGVQGALGFAAGEGGSADVVYTGGPLPFTVPSSVSIPRNDSYGYPSVNY